MKISCHRVLGISTPYSTRGGSATVCLAVRPDTRAGRIRSPIMSDEDSGPMTRTNPNSGRHWGPAFIHPPLRNTPIPRKVGATPAIWGTGLRAR